MACIDCIQLVEHLATGGSNSISNADELLVVAYV